MIRNRNTRQSHIKYGKPAHRMVCDAPHGPPTGTSAKPNDTMPTGQVRRQLPSGFLCVERVEIEGMRYDGMMLIVCAEKIHVNRNAVAVVVVITKINHFSNTIER